MITIVHVLLIVLTNCSYPISIRYFAKMILMMSRLRGSKIYYKKISIIKWDSRPHSCFFRKYQNSHIKIRACLPTGISPSYRAALFPTKTKTTKFGVVVCPTSTRKNVPLMLPLLRHFLPLRECLVGLFA